MTLFNIKWIKINKCHPVKFWFFSSNFRSSNGLFEIEWLENGQVAMKASNNKYIQAKMNGSLFAVDDAVTDKSKYYLTIINRPILVLKCDYGFVGFKSSNNPRIECNKASHDAIYLEHSNGKSGEYFLKGGWSTKTQSHYSLKGSHISKRIRKSFFCLFVSFIPIGCGIVESCFWEQSNK